MMETLRECVREWRTLLRTIFTLLLSLVVYAGLLQLLVICTHDNTSARSAYWQEELRKAALEGASRSTAEEFIRGHGYPVKCFEYYKTHYCKLVDTRSWGGWVSGGRRGRGGVERVVVTFELDNDTVNKTDVSTQTVKDKYEWHRLILLIVALLLLRTKPYLLLFPWRLLTILVEPLLRAVGRKNPA